MFGRTLSCLGGRSYVLEDARNIGLSKRAQRRERYTKHCTLYNWLCSRLFKSRYLVVQR